MSVEVLYKRMYGYRVKIAEYIAVYLISLVMNYLSDQDVLNGSHTVWQKMTDLNNSAVFVLVLLIGFAFLFYVLLAIFGYYTRKRNLSAEFTEIMKAHTEEIAQPAITGGLSWGLNRTLWMAPTMVLGLPSKSVMMANYDDTPYDFAPDLREDFDAFVASGYMKQIQKVGNDLPRYMLTRYGSNFDKENPLLTIQLKKTFWRHCQFVWRRYYGEENELEKRELWRNQIVSEHLESGLRVARYPNSFCLHLVIETENGNVLITEISKEKVNDYPTTKAVSLGEQIELSDFVEPKDFQQDFVKEWTRRAVCEEFGITGAQYEEEFEVNSLRVLSLDMEMDIYNFALVCTIKMRHSCEQFTKIVNTTIEQKEISNIIELPLSEVPSILMEYPKNKDEYHPSSYLRLLVFYLYKNGYRRTCERICRMK